MNSCGQYPLFQGTSFGKLSSSSKKFPDPLSCGQGLALVSPGYDLEYVIHLDARLSFLLYISMLGQVKYQLLPTIFCLHFVCFSLLKLMSPNLAERETFINKALKWSIADCSTDKSGHPALHRDFAGIFWEGRLLFPQNFRHF